VYHFDLGKKIDSIGFIRELEDGINSGWPARIAAAPMRYKDIPAVCIVRVNAGGTKGKIGKLAKTSFASGFALSGQRKTVTFSHGVARYIRIEMVSHDQYYCIWQSLMRQFCLHSHQNHSLPIPAAKVRALACLAQREARCSGEFFGLGLVEKCARSSIRLDNSVGFGNMLLLYFRTFGILLSS
jgi:hypothetical protein